MASGHGGRRPGAGRKPGQITQAKRDIMQMAKSKAEAALATLEAVMLDDDAPHAARVSAANSILDRGYGRPVQAMEHSNPDGTMARPVEVVLRGVSVNGND